MSDHLPFSWVLTLAGLLSLFWGSLLLITDWWALGVILVYLCCVLLWCARREALAHRRWQAEQEWWRRRRAGEWPDPLVPCCLEFRRSGGAGHDDVRCTRDRTEEIFAEIVRHLEEDPGRGGE